MACPTCDHTMKKISKPFSDPLSVFWCPRCGTISGGFNTEVPNLVERARAFENGLGTDEASGASNWIRLGIGESINLPGERRCAS